MSGLTSLTHAAEQRSCRLTADRQSIVMYHHSLMMWTFIGTTDVVSVPQTSLCAERMLLLLPICNLLVTTWSFKFSSIDQGQRMVQVCLFSYGQTGAGKTHTMQGSKSGDGRGIIPRAILKVSPLAMPCTPHGTGVPYHGTRGPSSWDRGPLAWYRGPLSWHRGSLSWYRGPLSWHRGSLSWYRGPLSWHRGSLSWYRDPLVWQMGSLA